MQALVFDLLCALDPVEFSIKKLGITPDPWQRSVLQSSSKRIILRCSRQSGKSEITAIAAVHLAVYRPNSLILVVSAGQRQSRELLRKIQSHLATCCPDVKLEQDSKLETALPNGSRIISLPSSEKTIRGYSAVDLLIIDEAARVEDALYQSVRPMLAISDGKIMLLSTPWGCRGFFYNAWQSDEFEHYHVPATECPRMTPEYLAEERKRMGDYWFEQEFLCVFKDLAGSMFSHEEIANAINPELEMAEL